MSRTLNGIVREKIMDEGPPLEPSEADLHYVDNTLNAMSNVELLEYISGALQVLAIKRPSGHT